MMLSVDNSGRYMVRCLRKEKDSEVKREGGEAMTEKNESYCTLKQEVQERMRQNPLLREFYMLPETDSTNRVAKELARDGAPEGTLVVAVRQSSGRGRLGRSFFSPEGGIYMSLVLRPRIPPEQAVLVTTCAAVAVARAIEAVSGETAGIKWVNDIFINGKKVCGILAEAGFGEQGEQPDYVVLGIGINVERQSVPDDLKDIVGCLEDGKEESLSKADLIMEVWKEFEVLYRNLSTAVYMEEYKNRSILVGKEVTVCSAEGDYKAIVTDIDKEGHLILTRQGKPVILSTGEVSVRL